MRSRIIVAALALFAFAVPSHAYRMTAWVPSWDPKALEVMRLQAGNLHEANPGWYTIAADGTFTKNYKAEDPDMRAALTGTQLVPTIKNYVNGKWDGALVATIVGDPVLREKHAEALTQLVIDSGLDGIDVDYEAVPATARNNFTTFISILAGKLHASRRILSVTVHAKTNDSSTRNGPGAQDWSAIAQSADWVKIMAYDKHWSTSEAGPIAPLDWLDQVAAYAETAIGRKSIIGLPWYGYDWLGTDGKTVSYADATALAQNKGATVGRDVNGEATFTYDGRTVYFQDAAAYRAKVDSIMKKRSHIGGFAAWRVGAEDPAIWPIVLELTTLDATAIPVGQAPASFQIEGPAELQLLAGGAASAKITYTAIDGFNATVTASVKALDGFPGTAVLSAPTIARTGSATLVVVVPKTTPAGTYRLNVTLTGGGVTREKIVTLKVTAAPRKRRAV